MSVATFLAARELRVRWGRAVLAAAVVAGAVALSAGLELLGRGRERAVEARPDAAGPALRVVAAGVTAADAAALRIAAALPPGAEGRVRAALGEKLRRVEARAIARDPVSGAAVIARAEPGSVDGLAPGRVVLGSGLAERTGARAEEVVRVLGRSFSVGGVAPASGDSGDYAVVVLASDVESPAPNELHVFLEPGVVAREAADALRGAAPQLSVLSADRGDVAEGGLQGSIAAHRRALQLVTAVVAVLSLLVATHLDVSERRRELALLAAVGTSRASLAALVVQRTAGSAAAGAVAGIVAAVALAASRPEFLPALVPPVAALAFGVAVTIAVVAAVPVALAAARRDPVPELQES